MLSPPGFPRAIDPKPAPRRGLLLLLLALAIACSDRRNGLEPAAISADLVAHAAGGVDTVWAEEERLDLTYCVSLDFGDLYDRAAEELANAADAWQRVADVEFRRIPGDCGAGEGSPRLILGPWSEDGSCAPFPDGSGCPAIGVAVINYEYYEDGPQPTSAVLKHLLGHFLGFRDENSRPSGNPTYTSSNEDTRPLTQYDEISIMQDPECYRQGARHTPPLNISAKDGIGAQRIYGWHFNPNDRDRRSEPRQDGLPDGAIPSSANGIGQSFEFAAPRLVNEVHGCFAEDAGPQTLTVHRPNGVTMATAATVEITTERCGPRGAGERYFWHRAEIEQQRFRRNKSYRIHFAGAEGANLAGLMAGGNPYAAGTAWIGRPQLSALENVAALIRLVYRPNGTWSARPRGPAPTILEPFGGSSGTHRILIMPVGPEAAAFGPGYEETINAKLEGVRAWYARSSRYAISGTPMEVEFHVTAPFVTDVSCPPGRCTGNFGAIDAVVATSENEPELDLHQFDRIAFARMQGGSASAGHLPIHYDLPNGDQLEALPLYLAGFSSPGPGQTIHEIGHTLKLDHAQFEASYSGLTYAYRNHADVMGASFQAGDFGIDSKVALGWLPPTALRYVGVSGTYLVRAVQRADARGLRIPLAEPGEFYCIEARRPFGVDEERSSTLNRMQGVLIRKCWTTDVGRAKSTTIDATPATPSQTMTDYALLPGHSFHDPENEVVITNLEDGPAGSQVYVSFGDAVELTHSYDIDVISSGATTELVATTEGPNEDVSYFWFAPPPPGSSDDRIEPVNLKHPGMQTGVTAQGQSFSYPYGNAASRVWLWVSNRRGGIQRSAVDLHGYSEPPLELVGADAEVEEQPTRQLWLRPTLNGLTSQMLVDVVWSHGDQESRHPALVRPCDGQLVEASVQLGHGALSQTANASGSCTQGPGIAGSTGR